MPRSAITSPMHGKPPAYDGTTGTAGGAAFGAALLRLAVEKDLDLPRVEGLIGVGCARCEIGEGEAVVGAISLGVLGRRLPGDLGDVIVEAAVADSVVLGEQHALMSDGIGEVRSL